MKLQLEVTTSCNLSCEYCFRKRDRPNHVDLILVEKVADADELVLYGYGEPLLHPQITRILEMVNGETMLSTNGMIDWNFDEVLELLDRIGISIDFDARHRKGLVFRKIEEKLKKAGEKATTQIVLTRDNIEILDELVRVSAENGANVQLTNVVAGNLEMYSKTLYFEGSRFCVETVKGLDRDFILSAIRDWSRGGGEWAEEYRKILDRVYEKGYSINIPYILESEERIEVAMRAEEVVERCEDIARSYGVDFERASFFGDWRNRECPYEGMVFIRADGMVAPCMSFAYTHTEVVNDHFKSVNEHITADLNKVDIDSAFESMEQFNSLRKDMAENFPWCADCPHVSGCWYAKQNIDCYANSVSCSECLYSVKIARCLL
ncbi:radical SAM/SPASM domain-containing protein [Geoglobus ahangari]